MSTEIDQTDVYLLLYTPQWPSGLPTVPSGLAKMEPTWCYYSHALTSWHPLRDCEVVDTFTGMPNSITLNIGNATDEVITVNITNVAIGNVGREMIDQNQWTKHPLQLNPDPNASQEVSWSITGTRASGRSLPDPTFKVKWNG